MSTLSSSAVRIDSLWAWARATQGLLVVAAISAVVILICLGVDVKGVLDLQEVVAGGHPYDGYSEVERFNGRLEAVSLTTAAASAIAAMAAWCLATVLALALLTSLAWLNVAFANLRAIVPQPSFSPAVASLLWLLPGLNVITSYFVIDQLWKQSDPEQMPAQRGSKPVLLLVWWLSTLAVINCVWFIVAQRAFVLPGKELATQTGGFEEMVINLGMEMGVAAGALLSVWLMYWVIGSITHDQVQRLGMRKEIAGG